MLYDVAMWRLSGLRRIAIPKIVEIDKYDFIVPFFGQCVYNMQCASIWRRTSTSVTFILVLRFFKVLLFGNVLFGGFISFFVFGSLNISQFGEEILCGGILLNVSF